MVLLAEGGGGRPGDVDMPIVAGLHVASFASFARLSGQVPVVGIVAGRCFAGNAALLGCSDVIIATRRSNIGMGGPAMVEDQAAAVAVARHYLAFFRARRRRGPRPTRRGCAPRCPRTGCAPTTCAR